MTAPRSIAIVGASLAGVALARALRSEGYAERLTLIGAEPHAPYDRPPLSKGFLEGSVTEAELAILSDTGSDLELALDWRLGCRAVQLDATDHRLTLDDGSSVVADGIGLAVGARPRQLPVDVTVPATEGEPRRVLTLRTLEDALALRERLVPGSRLVIIGGGVIAAEVAGTAASMGVSVTVVERETAPMGRILGVKVASAYGSRFEARGIRVVTDATVTKVHAGGECSVHLADGTQLLADTVLIAIGSSPEVDWLTDTGLELGDGVRCGADGGTNVPGVVAVGDCASWWHPSSTTWVREEHWTRAFDHAGAAARRLLEPDRPPAQDALPASYIWSDQLGLRLQLAGSITEGELHAQVGGDPSASSTWMPDDVAGLYLAAAQGVVCGVLAVDQPREFSRWRRRIGQPLP